MNDHDDDVDYDGIEHYSLKLKTAIINSPIKTVNNKNQSIISENTKSLI